MQLHHGPKFGGEVPDDLFIQALATTSEISLITDARQNILYVADSFTNITGYSRSEALGRNCRMLQGPGTDPDAKQAIRHALAAGEVFRGEILNYRKDGSAFWNALTITPLRDGDGRLTHFVSVQRDINTRMALHEQLRFQALHDPVTGLPNRVALADHLTELMEERDRSEITAAVGMIDLDDFRAVNNVYGHEAGDQLLKEWAARMQAHLREDDFLGRMGGDEFILVLKKVTRRSAADQLEKLLSRLHSAVDAPFAVAGERMRVGMSMGVALFPEDGSDTASLLRSADGALYRVKKRKGSRRRWWKLAMDGPEVADQPEVRRAGGAVKSGTAVAPALGTLAGTAASAATARTAPGTSSATVSDRGSVHDAGKADDDAASETAPTTADDDGAALADTFAPYRDALFSGGLRTYFQPVIDLRDGSVHLFEALARLCLPDGTVISPDGFIPYLKTAEVDYVFTVILDQALAQLAAWDREGFTANVSVNLAPATLLDSASPALIRETLRRYNIAPDRLGVELLETQSVEWEIQRDALVQLVQLGVGLAMDDLGAGYSSLKRLSILPFNAIKLDRGLLQDLRSSPVKTLSMVATLIQMGRDFGMNVVVEGLEDLGVTEAATILGAPLGQGYHFSRPMPAADAGDWARRFKLEVRPDGFRTYLGALAYHWQFARLGSPHPRPLEVCPLRSFLAAAPASATPVTADVERWHAQQHDTVSTHPGAGRLLVDWLEQQIRIDAETALRRPKTFSPV